MAELERMLAARSIAVVGASARPGSFGERLAIETLRSRDAGHVERVDLVHPTYAEVLGEPCVPSLDDVPHTPDLVLLGVPDAALPEQVARAAARGAGGAVAYGSAVGLGPAIREAAGSMPLCGAGCMGFANLTRGVRALGYLERETATPGGIALVTHSGSVFSALLRTHRRLEYSLAVSSGQELVTTTGDYLGWALDQPETRAVGLFLETVRDAPTLRAALARAAAQDVPVVALTVGGSPAGRAMVTAHSGAVAGEDAAWEALFTSYGVHRVRDIEELVDTLELFTVGRPIRRLGSGIGTVHDSGAERVLLADVASAEGVPFAPLAEATQQRLTAVLDDGLLVTNPLDVWGRGADTKTLFTEALSALADDHGVDVVALAIDLVEEYDGDDSYPRAAEAAHAATDKPVCVLSHVPAAVDQAQAWELRQQGIPVLEGARSGIRALAHLRAQADRVQLAGDPADVAGDPAQLASWTSAADSLAHLEAVGIAVVPTSSVTNADEAAAAAAGLGYPVVLKTDEPGIEHRARVGGVRLGITDEAALRSAYDDLVTACGPRVAVQPQLAGAAELALGMIRDPAVGPILMLAVGGSRIEELASRVLVLAPIGLAQARRVADRFARQVPGVDLSGVPEALAAFSDLVGRLGDRLGALDVNPLILTDAGPVAVDALLQPASD